MVGSDDYRLLPLCAVGLAKGGYEVFAKPFIKENPSTVAWGVLLGGVACYDLLAPAGHTLSEACDRSLEKHPVMTLGAIAITAGHLANIIPERFDPIHRAVELLK